MNQTDSYKKVTINTLYNELDPLTAYFEKGSLVKPTTSYKVLPEEEQRPDLVAFNFYGNWTYWWAIMVFNDILDPFNDLKAGDVIQLPDEGDIINISNSYKRVNA